MLRYLMGSRKMPLIPVALSLLVSFQSAILILGDSAEMYTRGTVRIWLAFKNLIYLDKIRVARLEIGRGKAILQWIWIPIWGGRGVVGEGGKRVCQWLWIPIWGGGDGWGRGNVYDKQVIMRVEKVVLSKQIILA